MNEKCLLLIEAVKEKGYDKNTSAMIIAQCDHESLGFSFLEESFNYSAKRLVEVFSNQFNTIQKAEKVVAMGHEMIANIIYANRMGNGTKESGDGYKYRGRGFIMLTGKNNYEDIGKKLNVDLLKNPDLAKTPELASKIAINFFERKPYLMKAASRGDVLAASSYINLGFYAKGQREKPNGFNDRLAKFEKWLKFLGEM